MPGRPHRCLHLFTNHQRRSSSSHRKPISARTEIRQQAKHRRARHGVIRDTGLGHLGQELGRLAAERETEKGPARHLMMSAFQGVKVGMEVTHVEVGVARAPRAGEDAGVDNRGQDGDPMCVRHWSTDSAFGAGLTRL